MQTSFQIRWPLGIALACLLASSCYPHLGQPYADSDRDWSTEARQACQRADFIAYHTLRARQAPSTADDLTCAKPPIIKISSSAAKAKIYGPHQWGLSDDDQRSDSHRPEPSGAYKVDN